jgi:hypothetical protein
VLAVPGEPGRTGSALLALGVVLAFAALPFAQRAIRRAISPDQLEPGAQKREPPALVVVIAIVSVLATAPFTIWRVIEDIGYTSGLSRTEAEAAGASYNSLEPIVFEELRRTVPPNETYYVDAADAIEARARDAFLEWSATVLLPRLPVAEPDRADWIIGWGIHPRTIGVRVTDVRVVHPPYASFPATYVARVAS